MEFIMPSYSSDESYDEGAFRALFPTLLGFLSYVSTPSIT